MVWKACHFWVLAGWAPGESSPEASGLLLEKAAQQSGNIQLGNGNLKSAREPSGESICSSQSGPKGSVHRDTSPVTNVNWLVLFPSRAPPRKSPLHHELSIVTGCLTAHSPLPLCSSRTPLSVRLASFPSWWAPSSRKPAQSLAHAMSPKHRFLQDLSCTGGGNVFHLTSRPEHTWLKLTS